MSSLRDLSNICRPIHKSEGNLKPVLFVYIMTVMQVYGLDPRYISRRAQVTIRLKLKVTRGPRKVKKGTAKKRPKTIRELPGMAPFVN